MQGYYGKPGETQQVLDAEGWFCTGDIGLLDEDGYLVITDRKKELLKTAGGKFVAPAPIENLLKTSPFIVNAMVVGDRRKFGFVAPLVPDFAAIEAAARQAGREFSTPGQMKGDEWVRNLLWREVERLTRWKFRPNTRSRSGSRCSTAISPVHSQDELTYTLKLKRRQSIEKHYQGNMIRAALCGRRGPLTSLV